MILICLFITGGIFLSYYYLLSRLDAEDLLHRMLTSSVLTSAQIIMTELLFGLFHGLYLSALITVNLSIAIIIVVLGHHIAGRGASALLMDDGLRVKAAAAASLDGHNLLLGVLAVLVYGWILVASYFLPPRGIDDLAYHLPAIFEYVQSHAIRLLPVDMLGLFAFPENAELLFMWPLLFTYGQRWVDGMNVPFVLLSVLTVYALLRHFAVREKDALFAALLYALCPVVLMQAGVNYIDIIVSLFFLLSLYYSLLFHERRRSRDLYLAGLSIGLMCGMKYTAILLAVPLQALIVPALLKSKWRHGLGYLSAVVLTGGWWYLRNAWMLGDMLYPMHMISSMPRAIRGTQGGSMAQNVLYNIPYWFTRYPLADAGVGGYDGGFGLVFWGMGFSSWLYVTVRSLVALGRTSLSMFVTLSYLPLGFFVLLLLPPQWVDVDGRLAMFVVVIGLVSLCEILRIVKDEGYIAVIKGLCIVLSFITVSLMSISTRPSYRMNAAITDAINHAGASEYKYLGDSIEPHNALRPAWELLDLLTRDDRGGLDCYIASDSALLWSAPVYGSRLQNRVLNMHQERRRPIDAYVCTFHDKNKLEQPLTSPGPDPDPRVPVAMTIRDVIAKDGYVSVIRSDHTCLLLSKKVFERPEKQRVLEIYYRANWPDAIDAAERLDVRLEANIPVIAAGDIGYGVRSVDMRKGRPNRVLLSFEHKEEDVASEKKVQECYTFGRPLSGYRSWKVSQVVYKGKELEVFLNRRS